MNNITEFQQYPLSLRQFWWVTGLVCIGVAPVLLLAVAVILCKRRIRSGLKALLVRFRKGRTGDIEDQLHGNLASEESNSHVDPKRE